MSFSELGRVVDQLVKDRGIKKEVIIEAIEQAFVVAARKKFGIQGEYEARFNEEDDNVEIFQYKNVVAEVRDPILEISHKDALGLDPDCEIGDQLGLRIENPGFTRIDVQTAKQIIFQKVRDAEREILFKEFKHRESELITGIARRYEKGNVIVDLGKADAILSRREIIPGETFKPGDRIQAYLSEVVMTNKGPELRLSRTSPMFMVKLFEMEVPEIQDGTIEIKSAAREPGHRAKIAVFTPDKDIDPVGACVGLKGSRVQNVVNELQGEKIDVVRWNPDVQHFVREALAPAKITSVALADNRTMDVIVEEDQLSLAIGRRGQNVRLAAMLTGWKVNIISRTKLQEKNKKAAEHLQQVASISDTMAQLLVYAGIMSLQDLKAAAHSVLMKITSLDQAGVERILADVDQGLADGTYRAKPDEAEDIISASAVPSHIGLIAQEKTAAEEQKEANDKFSEAEKRLREELAAFKLK